MNHSTVKQLHVRVRKNKKLCWLKDSLEVKKNKGEKDMSQESHFSSRRDQRTLKELKAEAPFKHQQIFLLSSE